MSRAATIRDIAREVGVSTATVSRTLNGDPRVLAATAAAVHEAAGRLGYSVNRAARSLKTRRTRMIGVMAPDLATDFFMILADRLERELADNGYGMLIASSRESAQEEERLLGLFAQHLVDGIVAIPATGEWDHFRRAVTRGTPLVLADRAPGDSGADAVLVDNEGGAREAVRELAGLGHRRIGFVGGDLRLTPARERFQGYRSALAGLGIPPEPAFERFGPMHIDSGYRMMDELLVLPGAPDAWFVVNADTHVGATNRLYREPSSRRERIDLAAFDEMPWSPLLRFCRFAVEQPVGEMGRTAARFILERVEGTVVGRPRTARLPTRIIRH